MTPYQFKRVETLFHKVRELPVDRREEFLVVACADDLTVRREVNALFESMNPAQRLTRLQQDLGEVLRPIIGAPADLKMDDTIGPYRIMRELGEGGMGAVYLAEQTSPLHRTVALKVIKLGMDTKQTLARFEAEREALAMMNHPNVAKVFDAGATPQGRPYFAMEYVDGEPITHFCDEHQLTIAQRLRLFVDVCRAVQHAHQKGIIHRDLKPSNVLVTEAKEARIIDFGVAKATQQQSNDRTAFTEQGQLIGTPGYMSPEQAGSPPADIDTRTDVYSLGVLLYELLAGVRPFDDALLHRAGLPEFQRIIREVDPPKPSTRLNALQSKPSVQVEDAPWRAEESGPRPLGSGNPPRAPEGTPLRHGRGSDILTIAHRRRNEPKTLFRQIRGDLDGIVMKCLEKDRTRRYETANALAMDIERHLSGEPVLAGPASRAYRLNKFVRRHKRVVAAVAAVALALTIGAGVATVQSFRAAAARDEAYAVTSFLTDMLTSASPEQLKHDATIREALDRAAKLMEGRFTNQPAVEARVRFVIGKTYNTLGLHATAEQHLRQALALATREYGEGRVETVQVLQSLSIAIAEQRRFPEAETLFRRTLDLARQTLGEDNQVTCTTLNMLGSLISSTGRYAEAEPMIRTSVDQLTRLLGEEHESTLSTMHNLASTLLYLGRSEESDALCRRVIEIRRRVLGPDHPRTLLSMFNLASSFEGQARYADAEALFQEVLKLRRRILGPDHPSTIESLHGLASVALAQARYEDAEKRAREILEVSTRVHGRDHLNSQKAMLLLAHILSNAGRHLEAEQLERETLEIRRRTLGPNHRDTLTTLDHLGLDIGMQGRWADAEQLHRESVETRKRTGAGDRIDYIYALLYLGNALLEQSKFAEAEPIVREALAGSQESLPPDDKLLYETASTLGAILTGLERYEEAEPLLLKAQDALHGRSEYPMREQRGFIERVVNLYDAWHADEPADGHDAKAKQWRSTLAAMTNEPPP